jgi:hypothetical protein
MSQEKTGKVVINVGGLRRAIARGDFKVADVEPQAHPNTVGEVQEVSKVWPYKLLGAYRVLEPKGSR